MNKEVISVHYDELTLKGKLRPKFEKLLYDNIKSATEITPTKSRGRLFLERWDDRTTKKLALTPGISWIGDAIIMERDLEALKENIRSLLSLNGAKAVNIDVRRIDKSFGSTSLLVKGEIMKALKLKSDSLGYKIRVEIMKDNFVINYNIKRCMGGMPIGSAGKVLSLFSGGIDSAVIPFELMKRGCVVDLLHVYALPTVDGVLNSKIFSIARTISETSEAKLYLVPFHDFAIRAAEINSRYELVLFKRFLLKLAEKLADTYDYKGVATGDSISQVASQTLDNLNAVSYGINVPVFRPLITKNKEEIISLARTYGTYENSIEKYRDCCSIVSSNPITSAKRDILKALEIQIGMDKLIEESISKMSVRQL
jgi:thiamine biosynthesis protein ThiI